jgi:hypothetical protein
MLIAEFIYESILTRFGCTFILVSDQNTHFINYAIEMFTNHFLLWNTILTTYYVTTLALGLRLRQGLAKVHAKMKPRSHISCSQECKKVWENEPPHSQLSSHFGSCSLDGLPNFQKAISGVKTHWIEKLFIFLETHEWI